MTDLITDALLKRGAQAEEAASSALQRAEKAALDNTARVLAAFCRHRVSDSLFAGTTGYGYDDAGRDTLDRVYADVFFAEAALVRVQFVNGTHAISAAMYACLIVGSRMDDEMTDLYQRNREEHNGDKDEEKSEHAGAAYDREASGQTL